MKKCLILINLKYIWSLIQKKKRGRKTFTNYYKKGILFCYRKGKYEYEYEGLIKMGEANEIC